MGIRRTSLTIPEEWYQAFTAQAEQQGQTFSDWLTDAGLAALPAKARSALPDKQPRGRPKTLPPSPQKRRTQR